MDLFPSFKPLPLIRGHLTQTIVGSFINFHREPISQTEYVPLLDGDKLALEVTTPKNWQADGKIIVMIHGLCGSHRSAYMIRMAKRFSQLGVKVVRLNLRGCGSGKGLARKIYISDASQDIHLVLLQLKKQFPLSSLILIGFSLGGNIALKLAGELGKKGKEILKEVIAISPPVNLETSAYMMSHPKNWMYDRYLTGLLVEDTYFRHAHFPDLGPVDLPKEIGIMEFDELYLAPQCGFKKAKDYYKASSAIYHVENIQIPCKVLFSEDDPIIEAKGLDYVSLPSKMIIHKTKGGGHMGFLSLPHRKVGVRWMDGILLSWVFKESFL